jgi:RNA polymerase sigma-70 factor (ECF subfamily)
MSTRLLRALYLVTGSRQEAEELTQEAFLKVWERWPRVSAMEDPTGYLYRTAMNAFRSRGRRARLAATRVLRPGSSREVFSDVENRDVVVRALASLTPRQRAALVVTELLEYDSQEAAKILGAKPETVRSLASQGRAALRDSVDPDDV